MSKRPSSPNGDCELNKKNKNSLVRDISDCGEGPSSGKRIGYSKYFKYNRLTDTEQTATCLLCQKIKKEKTLKMKNGNTNGLKKHLFAFHKGEHEEMFGQNLPKNQRTISNYGKERPVSFLFKFQVNFKY